MGSRVKKHRHQWCPWKKTQTMAGLRWWRYCTVKGCETHQHKKVYRKRKKGGDKVFELRCFIDGRRTLSHKLTKQQAMCFRRCARFMVRWLAKAYRLGR